MRYLVSIMSEKTNKEMLKYLMDGGILFDQSINAKYKLSETGNILKTYIDKKMDDRMLLRSTGSNIY